MPTPSDAAGVRETDDGMIPNAMGENSPQAGAEKKTARKVRRAGADRRKEEAKEEVPRKPAGGNAPIMGPQIFYEKKS